MSKGFMKSDHEWQIRQRLIPRIPGQGEVGGSGDFTSRISILLSFSASCFLSNIISADAGFNLGSKVFITCIKRKVMSILSLKASKI